jgi:hypothetical protein
MKNYVAIAVILAAFVTPALAAEFYVAQDPATKKCKIVDEKPDGQTLIMIGTTSYSTVDDAKKARTAATECPKKY